MNYGETPSQKMKSIPQKNAMYLKKKDILDVDVSGTPKVPIFDQIKPKYNGAQRTKDLM